MTVEKTKKEIRDVLDKAKENKIISQEEYNAMDPTDKDLARFYCNFKVHKQHKDGELPPVRPIVSGNNSVTEGISKYVEHFIKELATKHETYLQDTPDFLRSLEEISDIKEDDILASIDVKALFTNIPEEDGLESLQSVLETRTNKEVPTDFLITLMKLILRNNLFSFHDGVFRQEIGGAMGSPSMPPYADIFMAKKIDPVIKSLATQMAGKSKSPLKLLKRFLDDLFLLWRGTSKELHSFIEEINKIHPCIQFSMNHTERKGEIEEDKCSCKPLSEVPFLDTLCSIKGNKIEVDLYRKETDKNQYLLLNSCHPRSVTLNIPFSLSLRIVRICTNFQNRVKRLKELKALLLERGYKEKNVDQAIERAQKIPRKEALKKVKKTESSKKPVLTLKYDPRLPSVPGIVSKHYRSMICRDEYLKEVFKSPPLTAYKKQRNIRDNLIRAKVADPPKKRPERKNPGMKRCGKMCTVCPYVKEVKEVKINNRKGPWKINKNVNCETRNIIYMIECLKCKERYIGESKRTLKSRLADHRGYINNIQVNYPTGAHFNTPGHQLSDLSVIILEKSRQEDNSYRKGRESYFINLFNTYYKGLNKQT